MKPGETIVPLKPKVERLPTESVTFAFAESSPKNVATQTPRIVTESKASAIDLCNARSVVEAYVALALAGDVSKAAALAKNSPAAVKLDEEHKQPDGQREGFMVFRLEQNDDKWFVIDIDFETESGAAKELKKFIQANPNSIGLPPQSQSLSR